MTTAVLAPLASVAPVRADTVAAGPPTVVLVTEAPGAGDGPEQAVARLDGRIERQLEIIDGFSATVPASAVATLRSTPGVARVSLDGGLELLDSDWDEEPAVGSINRSDAKPEWKRANDFGSAWTTGKATGAHDLWGKSAPTGGGKLTGRGVDVALIDSGVVPVEGLNGPGKVVHGPDLSLEAPSENVRHLDTFGHGTHMAGIIAGRDTAVQTGNENDDKHFTGVAPDARLLSVKVAAADGATDVSQVIAALDWVVQHRNDNGMNIRVINLSFGTDSTQSYLLDPLAHAAEVAWRKGIVVVVSAGNDGLGTQRLTNPAIDPYVLAVGAGELQGTFSAVDDTVASFTNRGNTTRRPDLVAPGRSVVSLRAPGSQIDVNHPEGRVADRFFRGSGTSQAAATVSGLAALLIQERPGITPDQVKRLLTTTAQPMPRGDALARGAGLVDAKRAQEARTPNFLQTWPTSSGVGSLEAARGTSHLVEDGVELRGERDIFGAPWEGVRWSQASAAGTSWTGGTWNGVRWSGDTWAGVRWSGVRWSGVRWSGVRWSGDVWSGVRWSGGEWQGVRWSGVRWSGVRWSGGRWVADSWS